MPTIALENIADGAPINAAPHRNNYAAIQAAVNGLDGTNFGAGALAATHIFRARVSGDSDPRLAIQADGTLVFGSGAAVGDVHVSRPAADVLRLTDTFETVVVAVTAAFRSKLLAADANPAFRVLGDGKQEWGAGGLSAVDTNLYRAAADTLKTDDFFHAVLDITAARGGAGQAIIGATGPAAQAGLLLGSLQDTNLYRAAADTLKTDDRLQVARGYLADATIAFPAFRAEQVAAQTAFANHLLAADANPAFRVLGDGKQEWGAGGLSAVDTTLYRFAAAALATDSDVRFETIGKGPVVRSPDGLLRRRVGIDNAGALTLTVV